MNWTYNQSANAPHTSWTNHTTESLIACLHSQGMVHDSLPSESRFALFVQFRAASHSSAGKTTTTTFSVGMWSADPNCWNRSMWYMLRSILRLPLSVDQGRAINAQVGQLCRPNAGRQMPIWLSSCWSVVQAYLQPLGRLAVRRQSRPSKISLELAHTRGSWCWGCTRWTPDDFQIQDTLKTRKKAQDQHQPPTKINDNKNIT